MKEVNAGQFWGKLKGLAETENTNLLERKWGKVENGGKLQSHANVLRCTVMPIGHRRNLSVFIFNVEHVINSFQTST